MWRTLIGGSLVALVALLAAPAHAGGSTSVLVTDQSAGRAAALVASDPRYAQLDRLLQQTEPATPSDADTHMASLTVSWLAHDQHVWRTDQVLLDAPGGPLVLTRVEVGGGGPPAEWRRVTDEAGLRALLARLGIGTRAGAGADTTAPGNASVAPAQVVPATTEPGTGREARGSWFHGGWWLASGLLAGLVIGALAGPGTRRAAAVMRRR